MADDQRPSGSSSFSKQVKKRMTLSAAVKRFKSKIGSGGGGSSGTPRRFAFLVKNKVRPGHVRTELLRVVEDM